MPQSQSPLNRGIGLTGVIRFCIAVAAVLAIAAAFSAGRYWLGITGILFLIIALVGAYRIWRARRDADGDFPDR